MFLVFLFVCFFFCKGWVFFHSGKNTVLVSMVVLLAVQMHPGLSGFLCTIRVSQDKMLLCSSAASGRAEPVPCKSEWVAQLKLCGSGSMI